MMMKFYQEITLLADAEISPYFLWQKLYTQLHIALVDVKNKYDMTGIGVSFPQYRYEKTDGKTIATLGTKLRVFANTEDELLKLNLNVWLERLSDYVHLKSIQPVPKVHSYAIFKRYHPRNNLQVVAERFAKHRNIDFLSALQHCQTHKAKSEPYPFIALKSKSSGNPYQLHIVQVLSDSEKSGTFNAYGVNQMNGDATIPHW